MSCIYCGHNNKDEIFLIEGSENDYICMECAGIHGIPLESCENDNNDVTEDEYNHWDFK